MAEQPSQGFMFGGRLPISEQGFLHDFNFKVWLLFCHYALTS